MAKILSEHPEEPTPIDPHVQVKGLTNPTTLVLLGFPSTKVLEACLKSGKTIDYCIIIEPNIGRFHALIRRELITQYLSNPKFEFLIGVPVNEVFSELYSIYTKSDKDGNRATRAERPEVIFDPFAYPQVDGQEHPEAKELNQVVVNAAKQVFLSMGCASDSFYRWERFVQNKDNIMKSYLSKTLFGKFEDIPIVVLGGGKSCDEFLEAYHEYKLKDKCLIIACDAVLALLLSRNVKPHLVTRCERKISHIFKPAGLPEVTKADTAGIIYCAYPWTPPEFFDLFDETMMIFRGNGLCKWSPFEPGEVNGGVSAANAAMELALMLGSKNIIMAGTDLCHVDGKSHVGGTEVEFDINKSKDKWSFIPGNHGQPVESIPVWIRCLREYELGIAKHVAKGYKGTVYNTAARGAVISGTKLATWEKLAQDVPWASAVSSHLGKYLEKHTAGYEESYQTKVKDTLKDLKQIQKELDKLFININDTLLIARREEQRVVDQTKAFSKPDEFIDSVEGAKKTLINVFKEAARQIDQFKVKHFTNNTFSLTSMDICQIDVFTTENRVGGLINLIPIEYRRLNNYCNLYLLLFKTLGFYNKKLIDLFEKGPDQSVTYDEVNS